MAHANDERMLSDWRVNQDNHLAEGFSGVRAYGAIAYMGCTTELTTWFAFRSACPVVDVVVMRNRTLQGVKRLSKQVEQTRKGSTFVAQVIDAYLIAG